MLDFFPPLCYNIEKRKGTVMKKKIPTKILLFLLLGLFVYDAVAAALAAVKTNSDVIAAIAPFAALVLLVLCLLISVYRSTSIPKKALAATEARYESYLKAAFSHRPAARRKLLSLLAVSDKERPERLARAFLSLEKEAKDAWDMATLLFFAARATAQAGDRTGAVRLYRRAIGERGDYASAWSNLGVLYQLDSDYPAAEECFEKALSLEPEEPLRYHNLANLYLLAGKPKEAAATAKEAIARKSDFREAYLVLTLAAAMAGDENEARRKTRKCVELGGNEGEINRLVDALLRGERDVLIPAERTVTQKQK